MAVDIERFWPEWHAEELIGRGTFGDVYRIRRENGGIVTYAALKVIRIPRDESELRAYQAQNLDPLSIRSIFEDSKNALQEEIAIMTSLKSSLNIVSIEDYHVEEIQGGIGWIFYIRMELLESMGSYLQRHELSTEEKVRLVIDISSALVSCSKKNIIHRDIKPENVFRNEDGAFKLGDFGIARRLEGTMSAHSKAGAPMFEAPEISRGLGYDRTVDIYSLGIMLYIYFNNGRVPFIDPNKKNITRSDLIEAGQRRLKGEPLPKPGQADEKLSGIILKACAYEPSMRYQSADEMLADLKEWQYMHEGGYVAGKEADETISRARSAFAGSEEGPSAGDPDPESPGSSETFYWKADPEPETPVQPEKGPEDGTGKEDAPEEAQPVNVKPEPKDKRSGMKILIGIIAIVLLAAGGTYMINKGNVSHINLKKVKCTFSEGTTISGEACVDMEYLNKTGFALLSFCPTYKIRDDVTDEELEQYPDLIKAGEKTDNNIRDSRIWGYEDSYIASGASGKTNLYLDTDYKGGQDDLYDFTDPGLMELYEIEELNANVIKEDKIYHVYYYADSGETVVSDEVLDAYTWPDNDFTELMPKPEADYLMVVWDDEYSFHCTAYDSSESKMQAYAHQCQSKGFDQNTVINSDYFIGYNTHGEKVSVNYDADEQTMEIFAYARKTE